MVRDSKSPHSTPTFFVHAALALGKPFAIVPCCVMSRVFPDRQCQDGTLVDTYEKFVKYLLENSSHRSEHPEWDALGGLSNAPATFNRLVTQLFRPLRTFVQTYFDDIFVHSRAEGGQTAVEVHLKHLRRVFEVMRANQLYANIDKCSSAALSAGSAIQTMNDTRVARACTTHQTHEVVDILLGSKGLNLWFSAGYAELARPLSDLLKKDADWRMARWLSFFAECNFLVESKSGKLNVLADALSRRPDYELAH
ncbi:Reverse transcriptase, partial [Phytophthora palmivora]